MKYREVEAWGVSMHTRGCLTTGPSSFPYTCCLLIRTLFLQRGETTSPNSHSSSVDSSKGLTLQSQVCSSLAEVHSVAFTGAGIYWCISWCRCVFCVHPCMCAAVCMCTPRSTLGGDVILGCAYVSNAHAPGLCTFECLCSVEDSGTRGLRIMPQDSTVQGSVGWGM